jgi:hypothetical protein
VAAHPASAGAEAARELGALALEVGALAVVLGVGVRTCVRPFAPPSNRTRARRTRRSPSSCCALVSKMPSADRECRR